VPKCEQQILGEKKQEGKEGGVFERKGTQASRKGAAGAVKNEEKREIEVNDDDESPGPRHRKREKTCAPSRRKEKKVWNSPRVFRNGRDYNPYRWNTPPLSSKGKDLSLLLSPGSLLL